MNWIWFGIYCDEKQEGIYTYGMKKFGKDEMEVYVDKSGANLNEVREFLMSIVAYVLESDVILHDGETIGFSENQRLPITRSKGVALEGDTLKIGYKGQYSDKGITIILYVEHSNDEVAEKVFKL